MPFIVSVVTAMAAREARGLVVGFGASFILGLLVVLASRTPRRATERPPSHVPFWVMLLVAVAIAGIGVVVWYGIALSTWTF